MKTIFSTLLFLLAFQFCFAQKSLHKKAENNFKQFGYADAANTYERILLKHPTDTLAMERLSSCYNKLNNTQKAEPWLAKVCSSKNTKSKYVKMYAQALAANGKYNEATIWYQKYLKTESSDYSAKKILQGFDNLQTLYRDSIFINIKPSIVNSAESDFSPAFYQNGIIFCSARNPAKGKPTYSWNNSFFIDIYVAKDSNTTVTNFGKPVNSPLHEGPATFSIHEDTIYFTRNNYIANKKSASSDGITKLKIFYSVFKEGIWQPEQSIPLNNDEYSNGHPTFSPDHKLYFTSDMPGGFGKSDLYYTKFVDSTWQTPVNLGKEINTLGNEMFPYIDSEGNLYFASNGQAGLGGLDVFFAKAELGKFSEPKNMGYPINSSADDFGLIVKENKGFFSSNRGIDSNNDNLYEFTIDKMRTVNIKAVDKETGKVINNFNIAISANKNTSISQQVDSVFTATLTRDENYSFVCSKNGYVEKTLILEREDMVKLANNQVITMVMEKASRKIIIELQSTEGKRLTEGNVQINNLTLGEIIKYATDKTGLLNIILEPNINYEITGSKSNYKTKTINIDGADIEKMKDEELVAIKLPLATALFDKIEVGQIIELEIKYDIGKATIRKDAAKELDKLIFFLKKNVNAKVEMGSHTDSRGSAEANLNLSQKRAASAAHYIVSKGISSKRIIPVGYGKEDLKVKEAVSEEDHQQNRRTTVKIVGI